jgi:hypothetical protein
MAAAGKRGAHYRRCFDRNQALQGKIKRRTTTRRTREEVRTPMATPGATRVGAGAGSMEGWSAGSVPLPFDAFLRGFLGGSS